MSQAGNFFTSGAFPPGSVVQTLKGNSGGPVGPDGTNNINVVGDGVGITVAGSSVTNTLTISLVGGGPVVEEFHTDNGDVAIPIAGVINIITDVANQNSGSSVAFSGIGNIITLNLTDSNINTIIGQDSGNPTISGLSNTVLGASSAINISTGNSNTFIGGDAAPNITTGNLNTIIGSGTAELYTSSESSNIIIGADIDGVTGESNVLRIGVATGTADGELNKAFISGIDGINVGSTATVVTEVGNQLGTAVITAGTGITITPGANLITIASSGSVTLAYTNVTTSPYVVLITDDYLSVDSTAIPITIQLPNAATLGRTFVIKDRTGTADTNNITVTTVGGVVNIDGSTTFVMDSEYQSVAIIGNGSSYEIY